MDNIRKMAAGARYTVNELQKKFALNIATHT